MADNVTLDPGATPSLTFGTDEVGGVHYQRIKKIDPTDGSSAAIGNSSNPEHVQSTASTATLSNVAGSASNATLAASNSARKGLIIFNDSTAALYIKYGATASTSSFTYKVYPNGQWEMPWPVFPGTVDGIWDSATGNARVTELT